MALDRWIALVFVAMCFVYGYAAFFTMDDLLPPILQRNPIWPSTFPKILSICGVIVGLIVLFGSKPPKVDAAAKARGLDPLEEDEAPDDAVIDLKRLGDYNVWQAVALLVADGGLCTDPAPHGRSGLRPWAFWSLVARSWASANFTS